MDEFVMCEICQGKGCEQCDGFGRFAIEVYDEPIEVIE